MYEPFFIVNTQWQNKAVGDRLDFLQNATETFQVGALHT
jgi:hypothetical protein